MVWNGLRHRKEMLFLANILQAYTHEKVNSFLNTTSPILMFRVSFTTPAQQNCKENEDITGTVGATIHEKSDNDSVCD